MKEKSTHERRQHAMRVAGVVTALIFVVWVTTLGVRLSDSGTVAQDGTQTSLSASAILQNQDQYSNSAQDSKEPRLEVSTTSVLQ